MNHGSLFSGIGGFDLAAEWMGWQNKFHCEWNPFGQKLLHYYWPDAEQFTDITKSNFKKYANKIDILTGGFPCQPYSSAGKRRGKADDRHLWPEMLRAIREIQPRWIVGENVRGLTNWNRGMVFNEVQADLETIGYEITPFLLPACAVNAPHRRDRIWFIAYSACASQRRNKLSSIRSKNGKIEKKRTQTIYNAIRSDGIERAFTNSDSNGQQCGNCKHEINTNKTGFNAFSNIKQDDIANSQSFRQKFTLQDEKLERGRFGESNKRNVWDEFPSVSPICIGDDGFSNRLDGITFSKWRQESVKAAGNAIVPQVALQIFKAIEKFETLNKTK